MKTEFIAYLENLKLYALHHHLSFLQDSRKFIAEAQNGKLAKINRVFMDFPLEYDLEMGGDVRTFCAVILSKKDRWIKRYEDLIATGKFEKQNENDSHTIIPSADTTAKIKAFNADILITACVDLLDEKSNLKNEVINFFGLQEFIKQHQSHQEILSELAQRVIYSYWMEIVIINLGMIAVKKDCNVEQLELLNGYSKTLLMHDKQFTPFFHACITEYQEKFAEVNFAAYLRDLPVERVTGRMNFNADDAEDRDQ